MRYIAATKECWQDERVSHYHLKEEKACSMKQFLKNSFGSWGSQGWLRAASRADAGLSIGESILRAYPMSSAGGFLNGSPVAVVTKDVRSFGDFISWFRALGSDVVVLELEQLKPFVEFRKNLAMVVIDLDDGELDASLEELASVREAHPALAVILASRFFGRDDFSLSRMSVGDVSLRLPLSMRKLDLAVVLALENNKEWRVRRAYSNIECERGALA